MRWPPLAATSWPWQDRPASHRIPWAVLTYLAGTTALVLVYISRYSFLPGEVPAAVVDFWAYRVQELTTDPGAVALHLVVSVWANYYILQFLYVSALIAIFGSWFERHEGWLRTTMLFYGASIAAGLVGGAVLLVLDAAIGSAWIEQEAARVWVGGSAGAYGLFGGIAARTLRPVGWLAAAVVWELALGLVYLQSITPLWHFTALATGYLWVRHGLRVHEQGT